MTSLLMSAISSHLRVHAHAAAFSKFYSIKDRAGISNKDYSAGFYLRTYSKYKEIVFFVSEPGTGTAPTSTGKR